jgi:hypothetical protein
MGMWVSQASSMQRSGRAGRLFPGTIFRIYSRNFYSMLPAYPYLKIAKNKNKKQKTKNKKQKTKNKKTKKTC